MGKTRPPSFFPNPAILAICLLFVTAFQSWGEDLGSRQPAWVEQDVDRPGSDFKILWLRGGPEACREACAQNPLCKSYTYVRSGVAGRMEGCWLKDSVPPPVADNCCVSGVKTGETVSVAIREPSLPAEDAEKAPVLSAGEAAAGESPARKPETPEERIPETGSGKRIFSGMNLAAMPSKAAEAPKGSELSLIPSALREVGTGTRQKTGMNFSAALTVSSIRSVPELVFPDASPAETGTGRKEIRGINYFASPMTVAGNGRTGSATRMVTGVDITAVPLQR